MTEAPSNIRDQEKVATRRARRERRRHQSREDILDAARRVLLKSGIAAMTLDAVATEAGMSKTGLYYYFRSKDALIFELVFGVVERQARAVEQAVAASDDGGDALAAIVRETVQAFGQKLDDFRLAFLFAQVAGAGTMHWDAEQFERIRPLNDMLLGGATEKLLREREARAAGAAVEPRLLAFLAYLSAIGLLTMKGMVERMEDPLLYSDAELVEGFIRVFRAAAGTDPAA